MLYASAFLYMKNYLFFVRKRNEGNKIITSFNMVLSFLALTVFLYAITIIAITCFGKDGIKQCLSESVDKYGLLANNRNTYENERRYEYYDRIFATDEVASIGNWSYGVLEDLQDQDSSENYWQQIVSISKKSPKAFAKSSDNGVDAILMNYSVFKYNNIVLQQGKYITPEKEDTAYIYLGANYKSIPVGTCFIWERYGRKYIVAGILECKSNIIDYQTIFMNSNGLTFNYTINIDNAIIVLEYDPDNYHSLNAFFSVAEGYTYDAAKNRIQEISDELGIGVTFERLSHRIDTITSMTDWLQKKIVNTAYVLLTAVFFIVVCAQFISATMRKEEVGVLIASGYGKKDISFILFFENLYKLFIGLIPAILINYLFLKLLGLGDYVYYHLRWELFGFPHLITLLVVVLLAILTAIIPIISIKRISISDLVKGNWELSGKKIKGIKDNTLFFTLLILSFIVTFIVIIYALSYISEETSAIRETNQSANQESYTYGSYLQDGKGATDVPEWTKKEGNLFLILSNCVGENVAGSYQFFVLLDQNEELKETIHYKDYYANVASSNSPVCIIGDYWIKDIFSVDGKEYFNVAGINCLVAGILESQTFSNIDERIYLLGDSLLEKNKNDLIDGAGMIYTVIQRSEIKNDGLKESFINWSEMFLEKQSGISNTGLEIFNNNFLFQDYSRTFMILIYGMLVLCLTNCTFLAYVWGKTHIFDYSLKQILGYSTSRLIRETTVRFFIYEIMSFALAMLICTASYIIKGKLSSFIKVLSDNVLLIVLIMLILAYFISLFSMLSVMKTKPIYIVKSKE